MNQERSILIAEDEAITAMHFEMELEALGYRNFFMTSDSESAVRTALEQRPDVILMDVNLPGEGDGIDAARRILSEYSPTIIFITGYDSSDIRERAESCNPSGYYVKPLSVTKIHSILEAL